MTFGYIHIPGQSLPAAPVSDERVRSLVQQAALRGQAVPGVQSRADAVLADYYLGWSEQAGLTQAVADSKRADSVRADAKRYMDNLYRRFRADAASTFDGALTDRSGRVIRRPEVPQRMLDALPVRRVAPWAQNFEKRYVDHTGSVSWGRGGESSAPRADYYTDTEYRPVQLVWTAIETDAIQSLHAQSPEYGVDPRAEKQRAAQMVMRRAINRALISGVTGLDMWHSGNVPGYRLSLTSVFGTGSGGSNLETALAEWKSILHTVSDLSDDTFQIDSVVLPKRFMNVCADYVTTSAGFPLQDTIFANPFLQALAAYGITNVSYDPGLKNAGGSNVDRLMFYSSAEGGLRHVRALDITPLRTVQEGLADVEYIVARVGGLDVEFSGSNLIVEAEVAP